MLSYTHFTHDERISLHNFLKEGLGIREIARRLGRDPSTICRRRQQRRTALKSGTPQYDYTLEKLRNMWPPEAIANRFRLENPGQILSTSTIYRLSACCGFAGSIDTGRLQALHRTCGKRRLYGLVSNIDTGRPQ